VKHAIARCRETTTPVNHLNSVNAILFSLKFEFVVSCLLSLALAVNPKIKYVTIRGVAALNPEYTKWEADHAGAKAPLMPAEVSSITSGHTNSGYKHGWPR
jgi:hypothetical protein